MKNLDAGFKLWFYHHASLHGRRDTILKTAQDVVESLASAVLLCVMLLAALGWSLTRHRLTRRESRLILMILGIYFFVAFIKATCVTDDDLCKAYVLIEYLLKSVLLLGVLVSLNYTIAQLRLVLNETRWNEGGTLLLYKKLDMLQCVSLGGFDGGPGFSLVL